MKSTGLIKKADRLPFDLVEQMLDKGNLARACDKVTRNNGAPGINRMEVTRLKNWLKQHENDLRQAVINGSYQPLPVRRVDIPKEGGKTRQLGIPSVVDRLLQQAMTQVLQPVFEKNFSRFSFGYRPGKSVFDALQHCGMCIEAGYRVVWKMDIAKFFDSVDHILLLRLLKRRLKNARAVRLIESWLRAGIDSYGLCEKNMVGLPQGSPISPLLANLVLDQLDTFLETNGLNFARYADDVLVFVCTPGQGRRIKKQVSRFLNSLKLSVNAEKSQVLPIEQVEFLGYQFSTESNQVRMLVSMKSKKHIYETVRLASDMKSATNYK